jgi:hypothetical protein
LFGGSADRVVMLPCGKLKQAAAMQRAGGHLLRNDFAGVRNGGARRTLCALRKMRRTECGAGQFVSPRSRQLDEPLAYLYGPIGFARNETCEGLTPPGPAPRCCLVRLDRT